MLAEYEQAATDLGIKLMPWQRLAARYMTATDRRRWRFRKVCVVVARQNGKTSLLLPRILLGLRLGRRMLHTAQNRAIPRETFLTIARLINGNDEVLGIRFANGEETIEFTNGGRYTLVAPRPGIRGFAVDDVLLDEVREQRSFDLVASIVPTMTASSNPQVIYLSNAGDDESIVLNDLRRRKDSDPTLAYLEWSASPERSLDDRDGWVEANPALGVTIQWDTLADLYASSQPNVWETEHLCRWVVSMQPRLVTDQAWQRCRGPVERPRRPALAISMDPSGMRASAVIAWPQSDGTVGVDVIAEARGDPIDTDLLGPELRQASLKLGASSIAFDPWTDADLARHLIGAKALAGREYANASENFVRVIESGRLRWANADAITEDLAWAARKPHESGAWQAVRARDDRPISAVFAAIRAVWLASGPTPPLPKVM